MKLAHVPGSIKLFAICFALQATITSVHVMLNSGDMRLQINEALGTRSEGSFAVALVLGLRLAIALCLIWLVLAKRSQFARWAVVVFFFGRIWQSIQEWQRLTYGFSSGNLNSIAWVIESLLGLLAVTYLFLSDSRYWFLTGRSVKADASAFD